ncbi:MAG: GNAT family protein [Chloroflexota bacterium]|nr:GNAT family protein [Chloroflexota bacterium]
MRIDIGEWQIRRFQPDDAQPLAEAADNRKIWRNMRDSFPHPYTLTDAQEWIALTMQESPAQNFAIASTAQVVGGIGLRLRSDVFRRSAEIGYWLAEPFWGRGIATAALRALTEHAFEQFNLVRIDASVYEWNPASARVLEKAGYTFEARLARSIYKDGQIVDRLIYAKLRD